MKQRPVHHSYQLLSILVLISLLVSQFATAYSAPVESENKQNTIQTTEDTSGVLFRTKVTLRQSTDLAYLEEMGVVTLENGEEWALLLVTGDQLEALARLQFKPQETTELESLIQAHADSQPWLAESLEASFTAASAVQEQRSLNTVTAATSAQNLVEILASTTVEQQAALTTLTSIDDDGDGLTNTEELWWCTDPLNPNSDGDAQGYTDNQEITALLDFTLPRSVRWGYGAPFGPPNAWPDFNGQDGNPNTPACNDGDYDTIPDYAEAYIIGSRTPKESTDGDKFDDGQELFGTTYCPGAPTSCGHGLYPRQEYWNYIQADMPGWVQSPGDNLFVAAFPVPEVSVVPGSWTVDKITTITTEQGEMVETTNSYATSVTEGQSTGIENTVTWNDWEEVSEAVETPLDISSLTPNRQLSGFWGEIAFGAGKIFLGGVGIVGGALTCIETIGLTCVGGIGGGAYLIKEGGDQWADAMESRIDDYQKQQEYQACFEPNNQNNLLETTDTCPVISTEQSDFSVITAQSFETQTPYISQDDVQYTTNPQGDLLVRELYDISYAISQPRLTETKTNGRSWGGAQTTTQEEYEEHTITNEEQFTTGENWSTAWAVDSSHAADLTFDFTIDNTGTEYARELTGLIFNIYLGDDPNPLISYPGWEKFPNGKIENLFPADAPLTFSSDAIPLTLDQMRRIDMGERLTVVLEDYSYGADELFYQNASNAGLTVFIEDGVDDGDESVDSYVIPTWGTESVQAVLTRYFPAEVDVDGNLNTLWTPEFNGINPPTWQEHYLSDIAWWNIYQTCAADCATVGSTPLHEQNAQAGGAILFRFNRDSDRDGYQDRVELRYGTDKDDPASHPQPELLAGYTTTRTGDTVTAYLKLENSGSFDAYGIDAVMYAPDDTVTIGNNTVGGNGRVRPGAAVAVGSLILQPGLTNWSNSTAKPYATGNFTGGADKTITLTVSAPGVIGQSSTAMTWSDGLGGSGALDLGSSYHAPLPILVTEGIEVGFDTGTLGAGNKFAVTALTPRDTFTYTVEAEPYTPPVVVVSYSDPQGSHRFVTPVEIADLEAELAPYSGQMLKNVKLDIVTTAPVDSTGDNVTNFVISSPDAQAIEDAHLYLNFVSDGSLVAEIPYTTTIQAGPTVMSATWSTDIFTGTYNAAADNLLIAFWTDAQGNIIDSAARPLNTFQQDPKPTLAIATADETWDLGFATQGMVFEREFIVANEGFAALSTFVAASPAINLEQIDDAMVSPAGLLRLKLTLNTALLSIGTINETVQIRNNDPDSGVQTIQILGTVEPTASPVQSLQIDPYRPWNELVTISQTLQTRDTVTYNDLIGVDSSSVHPLWLYDETGQISKGVGEEIALVSAQSGFSPVSLVENFIQQDSITIEKFGTGRDGDLSIPEGSTFFANNPSYSLVTTVESGQRILLADILESSLNALEYSQSNRIKPGDEVMILQTYGENLGAYEFANVSAIQKESITLQGDLENSYTVEGASTTQIIKVPHYRNVTIEGTLESQPWDGNTGGVVVFRASGTTVIAATGNINQTGMGYAGGPGGNERPGAYPDTGSTGGSYTNSSPLNGSMGDDCGGCISPEGPYNGGGGRGGRGSRGTDGASGGGGGSYGSSGAWGTVAPVSPYAPGGRPGNAYGSANLATLYYGSGGGGGGKGKDGYGASGGNGGGIVNISSENLIVNGIIYANGNGGGDDKDGNGGGGGGGAGGSIFLSANTASLGNNLIRAVGGGGSDGVNHGNGSRGGNGGDGRIHLDYCSTYSGSTTPTFHKTHLTCFGDINGIVFVDLNDNGSQENGESGLAGVTITLVGTGQTRITGSNGSYSFIDINPGTYNLTVAIPTGYLNTTPGTTSCNLTSGGTCNNYFGLLPYNLEKVPSSDHQNIIYLPEGISALTRYWVQYGYKVNFASPGENVIQVVLPYAYSNSMSLDLLVTEASLSSAQIQIDVGDNGTWDWNFDSTLAVPEILVVDDISSGLNDFIETSTPDSSGLITVPLRINSSVTSQMYLTNLIVTPTQNIDLSITVDDVSISPTDPTEGDLVSIQTNLHNTFPDDSGGVTIAFFASNNDVSDWYLGSKYVANVSAIGTELVDFLWDSAGFTGDISIKAIVDPHNQLVEGSELNNEAIKIHHILTRPDLQANGITLSDLEPVVSETITISLNLDNAGQTSAASATHALYRDNPDSGGILIENVIGSALSGGGSDVVEFAWTPTEPGLHRLFIQLDKENVVNEFDESNNLLWRDVYVGFAGPLLLDSGSVSADPVYTPSLGYGYLNGQASTYCGSSTNESQRSDANGEVNYRFDYLLPGHFYHLDISFFECDSLNRVEVVTVDGITVTEQMALDNDVQAFSILLDPALYADRSIQVTINELLGNDAIVSAVNLHDIDYRYIDAGGVQDLGYTAERTYGWLDGVAQTPWGVLPYQSRRIDLADGDPADDPDSELRYRFDGLQPQKRYKLYLNAYQNVTATVEQSIVIDTINTGHTLNLDHAQLVSTTVEVPIETYVNDGSIVVAIQRTTVGPFVNELALEEITILPTIVGPHFAGCANNTGSNATVVVPTSASIIGNLTLEVGDEIAIFNANDSLCAGIGIWDGTNLAISAWGDDSQTGAIDGMLSGETMSIHIWDQSADVEYANVDVTYNPGNGIYSSNSFHVIASLDLNDIISQEIALGTGWNMISSYVIPEDPNLWTLFDGMTADMILMKNGQGQVFWPAYFINQIGNWNRVQGYQIYMLNNQTLTITGTPVIPENTPITLNAGWNLVSYLRSTPMPIDQALTTITGQFLLVKDNAGRVYWPAYFINQIGDMQPGQGYQIYMVNGAVLTYPANNAVLAAHTMYTPVAEPTHFTTCQTKTGNNATLVLAGENLGLDMIDGYELGSGDEIAVFDETGEMCVGVVKVTDTEDPVTLTVWGDNEQTEARDGLLSGDTMQFRVWSQATGKEMDAATTFHVGDGLYQPDSWHVRFAEVYQTFLPIVKK